MADNDLCQYFSHDARARTASASGAMDVERGENAVPPNEITVRIAANLLRGKPAAFFCGAPVHAASGKECDWDARIPYPRDSALLTSRPGRCDAGWAIAGAVRLAPAARSVRVSFRRGSDKASSATLGNGRVGDRLSLSKE